MTFYVYPLVISLIMLIIYKFSLCSKKFQDAKSYCEDQNKILPIFYAENDYKDILGFMKLYEKRVLNINCNIILNPLEIEYGLI